MENKDFPIDESDAALVTRKTWIECHYNGPAVNRCTFIPRWPM